MFDRGEGEIDGGEERLFSWRRIRTIAVGAIATVLVGALLVSLYTYSRYGGTPFDNLLGIEPKQSPAVGKFAYDKGTKFYIGIIKGEGVSPRRGQVYYIEQAGGTMIEVSKEKVEVREPGQ